MMRQSECRRRRRRRRRRVCCSCHSCPPSSQSTTERLVGGGCCDASNDSEMAACAPSGAPIYVRVLTICPLHIRTSAASSRLALYPCTPISRRVHFYAVTLPASAANAPEVVTVTTVHLHQSIPKPAFIVQEANTQGMYWESDLLDGAAVLHGVQGISEGDIKVKVK